MACGHSKIAVLVLRLLALRGFERIFKEGLKPQMEKNPSIGHSVMAGAGHETPSESLTKAQLGE